MSESHRIRSLLDRLRAGDPAAADQLFDLVYDDLRRRAHWVKPGERPATLNTTALVHEAFLRVRSGIPMDVVDERHFMNIVVRAMRQVVHRAIKHRSALKRGGEATVLSYEDHLNGEEVPVETLLSVGQALSALEKMEERHARVIECRFYAGLSVKETAHILDISPSTVKRDWRAAHAWLRAYLRDAD